jgi:hypothetical protein
MMKIKRYIGKKNNKFDCFYYKMNRGFDSINISNWKIEKKKNNKKLSK